MGSICPTTNKNPLLDEKIITKRTDDNAPLYDLHSGLIKKLEHDGYEKLKKIKNTQIIESIDNPFLKIIEDGAKEYKEKTGRAMTYAEMRAAYG